VIRIPGSELGGRGGPRALSCPVSRDSMAAAPAAGAPALTLVTGEDAASAEETAAVPQVVPLAPAALLASADADSAHLAGLSRAGARAR